MPVVPAGDLTILRTTPQSSKMYMVVQQPARRVRNIYLPSDFVWYGVIREAPADDPTIGFAVTANAASPVPTLKDGMTVVVDSVRAGDWDRGLFYVHGDQSIAGEGDDDTLYIAVSSECGDIEVGDHVAVLDEIRPRLRYPKITEAGGDLTWYKDYGYFRDSIGVGAGDLGFTWSQLGGDDDDVAASAALPAVPIMGPHVVKFLDDGDSVDINFDWSDSYAIATGGTVNAWVSEGKTDHIGGVWNDNVEVPGAKTYSNISGLRGFRVDLELGTDLDDTIVEFRRGCRYVFTLRRPGASTDTDPSDAEPITDFTVQSVSGSFDSGGWTAQISVYGDQADEYSIREGALVILFSEDRYGGDVQAVGPNYKTLVGRENIVMVGHVANNSVIQNSEYGMVTFTIVGLTELLKNRESYSVPIENFGAPDEWYKCLNLTVDRAAHHYLTWHTNMTMIADRYQTGNTEELAAQDFLAGDSYSTIDTFLWDRVFARFLCDRFGRTAMDIDLQMKAVGSGTTMFAMTNADWLREISVEEVTDKPVNVVDLGGLNHNEGLITPYLSHAPGDFAGYEGKPDQMMSLVIADQDELNTYSGRLYAYRNNKYPNVTLSMTNWRVMDIYPQEYVSFTQSLIRGSFSTDKFIVREISYQHTDHILSDIVMEMETDGPAGVSVPVPEDPPDWPDPEPWDPPWDPPGPGTGGVDTGRRIICSDQGVFLTDTFSGTTPFWYGSNVGLSAANSDCYCIRRDPFHWWTSGGTETTLWLATTTGIWKQENFPLGSWVQVITLADIAAAYPAFVPGTIQPYTMHFSVEVEGLFAVSTLLIPTVGSSSTIAFVVLGGAIINANSLNATDAGPPSIAFAQHSGGNTIYAVSNHAYLNLFNAQVRLYKTTNRGATWTNLVSVGSGGVGGTMGKYSSVSVPYVDAANTLDRYVIWGKGGYYGAWGSCQFWISDDRGATHTQIPGTEDGGYCRAGTSTVPTRQWYPTDRMDLHQCKWTNDGGATFTELPVGLTGFEFQGSWTRWNFDQLEEAIMVGDYAGGVPAGAAIGVWYSSTGAWADKRGNLEEFGITAIRGVDRDSQGAA